VRVLFVEDEPSQQEALSIALEAAGYTLLQASDVPQALGMLGEQVDAAILDVRLPDDADLGRNGLTILGELRVAHPHIPVAILTGVPLSDDDLNFVDEHRAIVLYKPQTFDAIFDFLTADR
jgi:CheY-like chemotaxis protein